MADWFALFCHPLKEPLATRVMVQRGIEVLFPHIPEWVGLSTHKSHLKQRAYYPRYIFVYTNDLASIHDIPGVIGPVRATLRMPFALPQNAVEAMKAITDPLGAVHVSEAPRTQYGLLRGHRVRIAEGNALWGLIATIAEVDGKSVSVVMKMLGCDRMVHLSVDQVDDPRAQDVGVAH